MSGVVFHVSDRADIEVFEPRSAPNASLDGSVVWAVDDEHLHNYLLPRDCPRVTFYPLLTSTPEDVERLMGGTAARAVVAIETVWFPLAASAALYLYTMDSETFDCIDAGAGYWVSRQTVTPRTVERIADPLAEMLRRRVELRVTPSLWPLRERVIASTLQFSIIRMRNATPPPQGPSSNS